MSIKGNAHTCSKHVHVHVLPCVIDDWLCVYSGTSDSGPFE